MSVPLINASTRINANTAGLTQVDREPPSAQSASPTEVITSLVHGAGGDLDALFGVGLPHESVARPIDRPTNSTAGRLGGLVPTSPMSGVQPGPQRVGHPLQTARQQATTALHRLRQTLGV